MIDKIIVLVIVFFLSGTHVNGKESEDPCRGSPKNETQAVRRTECYFTHNQPEKATNFLKEALSYHELSKTLRLLLARAYMLDNNNLWALKTLYEYEKNIPGDPEIMSWIVWCHFRQGQLAKAEGALNKIESKRDIALITRKKMLSAMFNIYQNNPEQAWKNWKEAKAGGEIYAEDKVLNRYALIRTDPRGNGPIRMNAGVITGYSTNPSITSSFKEEDVEGSPMLGENVSLHFEPPLFYSVKPFLTVSQKILYYSMEKASPYSYFIPDLISGVRFKTDIFEFMPSYHGGAFLLNSPNRFSPKDRLWLEENLMPEESYWFYEFHRFEIDINFKNNISLMAATGRRFFNQLVRTRWETDVTGIGQIFRSDNFRITGAFSLRMYRARQEKYNLLGGTALFSMKYWLMKGKLFLNIGALFSKDLYPDYLWGRDDILINILPGIWYRFRDIAKIGLTYEYARRYSNVEDYRYTDKRVNFKFNTSIRFYPFFIKTARPLNHVSLPYGLQTGSGTEKEDSIRELLEQREDIQRSSSCLE